MIVNVLGWELFLEREPFFEKSLLIERGESAGTRYLVLRWLKLRVVINR